MNNHKNIVFIVFIGIFVTFMGIGLYLYTNMVHDSNAKGNNRQGSISSNRNSNNNQDNAKNSQNSIKPAVTQYISPSITPLNVDEMLNELESENQQFPDELFETFDKELEEVSL